MKGIFTGNKFGIDQLKIFQGAALRFSLSPTDFKLNYMKM
jgi:hypothetical protein